MTDCYLTLELLPDELYPAFVHREDGITLLTLDPRATRLEATLHCTFLTEEEGQAYCDAFAAVVRPSAPDAPVCLYVPPSLRLDGEPATQGGEELLRRHEVGDIDEELALLAAEVRRVA